MRRLAGISTLSTHSLLIVHCTLHTAQCTLYNALWTLYSHNLNISSTQRARNDGQMKHCTNQICSANSCTPHNVQWRVEQEEHMVELVGWGSVRSVGFISAARDRESPSIHTNPLARPLFLLDLIYLNVGYEIFFFFSAYGRQLCILEISLKCVWMLY